MEQRERGMDDKKRCGKERVVPWDDVVLVDGPVGTLLGGHHLAEVVRGHATHVVVHLRRWRR